MFLASSMETKAGPKFSLLIVGRLHGVTRKRLRAVVERIGGELAGRPSSRVDVIALAHGSAPSVLRDAPRLTLPTGVGPAAKVISELTLKRMLGLVQPAAYQDRTLDEADLMRASKLSEDVLACLAAFDVLEPIDGRFIYRDVLVAREVRPFAWARLQPCGHRCRVRRLAALASVPVTGSTRRGALG